MYTKDKGTRITLRLNEKQFEYVHMMSDNFGVSPSEFLRILLNTTIASTEKVSRVADEAAEKIKREISSFSDAEVKKIIEDGAGRENEQTFFDNKL